jgi:uncharacterized protein (TIGR02118 family)
MIRLISLLPRAPHMTHEEFIDYWHNTHGPLVARNKAARFVKRYEQHATAWPADGKNEPPYDGVTIQEFDSVADFWAHNADSDAHLIMEDTANFLDMANLKWVLTEEPRLVIG